MNPKCGRCGPRPIYEFRKIKKQKWNKTIRIPYCYCRKCEREIYKETISLQKKIKAAYIKQCDDELTAMVCERFVTTGVSHGELVELFGSSLGKIQVKIRKYLGTYKYKLIED